MSFTKVRTLIVGGGFSGLGVARELLQRGDDDFIILEKAPRLGGTWRDNTYPGCACDVPSHLYSYSYAPNPEWSRTFAEQGEIQRYLERCAEDFGVRPYVRLSTEAESIEWDAEQREWRVETSEGPYRARFVVGAQGPLHEPRIPAIPGLDGFEGEVFHSARWRHDLALEGRRVAVVGTGSSAIQFVPRIQPQVERLHVFQRTPGWVLPKPDHATPAVERGAYRHVPGLLRAIRGALYGATELLQTAQRSPARMRVLQRLAEWQLERQVADPKLRAALTPTWTLGCKRMLLSNTYYPALQADNAELIPEHVAEVQPGAVVSSSGQVREVDTLIFATGFHVTDASLPSLVRDAAGRTLREVWGASPRAYLGTAAHGFPNLFFLLGPNTGNGHGSAFTIIEAQAKYIAEAIEACTRRGIERMEPRLEAESRFVAEVDDALQTSVWNAGGCQSWYLDDSGRNSTIYPFSTIDLRRRLRRVEWRDYHLSQREAEDPVWAGRLVAITGAARGVGRATAEQLVARGAEVLLGDVDEAELAKVARALGPTARAFPLDVTSKDSWTGFVAAAGRPVDVLINNAGIMPTGAFAREPLGQAEASMEVNYYGVVNGMRAVLPLMRQRGGHIVNVASLAGKFAVPGLSTYGASKHAVVGLSAAVRQELAEEGVKVSVVMPTAVQTALTQGIPLGGLVAQKPADVAREILRAVERDTPERTTPAWLGALVPMYGLLPRRALPWLSAALGARRIDEPAAREARRAYESKAIERGRFAEAAERDAELTSPSAGAKA